LLTKTYPIISTSVLLHCRLSTLNNDCAQIRQEVGYAQAVCNFPRCCRSSGAVSTGGAERARILISVSVIIEAIPQHFIQGHTSIHQIAPKPTIVMVRIYWVLPASKVSSADASSWPLATNDEPSRKPRRSGVQTLRNAESYRVKNLSSARLRCKHLNNVLIPFLILFRKALRVFQRVFCQGQGGLPFFILKRGICLP